jgi:hypothetical protein
MLPDETIANLVQRMQTLKYALAVQEQTAARSSLAKQLGLRHLGRKSGASYMLPVRNPRTRP